VKRRNLAGGRGILKQISPEPLKCQQKVISIFLCICSDRKSKNILLNCMQISLKRRHSHCSSVRKVIDVELCWDRRNHSRDKGHYGDAESLAGPASVYHRNDACCFHLQEDQPAPLSCILVVIPVRAKHGNSFH
jgi:hypothetical protein